MWLLPKQEFGQSIPADGFGQSVHQRRDGIGRRSVPVPRREHGRLGRRDGHAPGARPSAIHPASAQRRRQREGRRRTAVSDLRPAAAHHPVDQERRTHHRERILPGQYPPLIHS